MAIGFGSNIASLNSQRLLAKNSSNLTSTVQRLSSGARINRPGDDPAGLAVAESLNNSRRVFLQGVRNLNDGISALQIASSAVQALGEVVIRLRELAEQAANGVLGRTQRQALDQEAQALSSEYLRIIRTTGFGGMKLLDGSSASLRLQGGFGAEGGITGSTGGTMGTGELGTLTSTACPDTNYTGMATGDLNGDGVPDMVNSTRVGSVNQTTVYLGLGDGTFATGASYSSPGSSVALGDLNNDGVLDLVFRGTNAAETRLGCGDGTFGAALSFALPNGPIVLGDLNNDGVLDLATISSSLGITARIGRGDGSFEAAVSSPGQNWYLALGDMNSDGILDVVSAGGDYPNKNIAVSLGRGDGTFAAMTTDPFFGNASFGPSQVTLADLNCDGALDVAVAGTDGASDGLVYIYLGRGDGTLSMKGTYLAEDFMSNTVTLGDLNSDGILDLVTGGVDEVGAARATTRLGVGDGTFAAVASSYIMKAQGTVSSAVLADFNCDGVLDLGTRIVNAAIPQFAVRLSLTQDGTAPLLPFSLASMADAKAALSLLDQKQQQLGVQQGQLGAFQSRLVSAVSTYQRSADTYAEASSRIQDADIAEETANLVRYRILQDACAAVLAQANQQPAHALQLLSSV